MKINRNGNNKDKMKFSGQTFSNETINLDDNEFYDCIFIGCRLIYAGGETTLMGNSYDEQTTYTFSGAAANTLAILSALYADRGGKFITKLFENIRQTASGEDDILDADALDWKWNALAAAIALDWNDGRYHKTEFKINEEDNPKGKSDYLLHHFRKAVFASALLPEILLSSWFLILHSESSRLRMILWTSIQSHFAENNKINVAQNVKFHCSD